MLFEGGGHAALLSVGGLGQVGGVALDPGLGVDWI